MNMKNPYVLTLGAFLSAWAASNFAADYRSILWALLAGVFGYATPKKSALQNGLALPLASPQY
jgi:hypothetical protein